MCSGEAGWLSSLPHITFTWSNPTVVYVDSITVATPTLSFTLDAANTVTATQSNTDIGGQVMWVNNGSTDTTASNVALTWQATCP